MGYSEKCIVLYAAPYSIENNNGSRNEGVSFYYLSTANMAPFKDANNRQGYAPMKDSISKQYESAFTKVPAVYDIEYETRRGSDGKPQLKAVGVKYVSDLSKAELSKF
jgi:hypothetical protein